LLGIEDPGTGVGGHDAGDDAGDNLDADPDAPPIDASLSCDKVDLLFVIDSSGSMIEEQDNLRIHIPEFVDLLGDIDYRIAVTTPGRDLSYTVDPGEPFPPIPMNEQGDDGEFHDTCGLDRRWIQPDDADPSGLFSCRAAVGTMGPSLEMPLYAVKLATFDRVVDGTNAGFLRADAPLVIVVITDEDDCSREDNDFTTDGSGSECTTDPMVQPPDRYRDYLDTLKGDRDRWAMAIVAGPGPGVCKSDFGTAAEATRLLTLDADPSNHVVFESICNGNMGTALIRVLDVVDEACAADS
jgi:hypothetical protein